MKIYIFYFTMFCFVSYCNWYIFWSIGIPPDEGGSYVKKVYWDARDEYHGEWPCDTDDDVLLVELSGNLRVMSKYTTEWISYLETLKPHVCWYVTIAVWPEIEHNDHFRNRGFNFAESYRLTKEGLRKIVDRFSDRVSYVIRRHGNDPVKTYDRGWNVQLDHWVVAHELALMAAGGPDALKKAVVLKARPDVLFNHRTDLSGLFGGDHSVGEILMVRHDVGKIAFWDPTELIWFANFKGQTNTINHILKYQELVTAKPTKKFNELNRKLDFEHVLLETMQDTRAAFINTRFGIRAPRYGREPEAIHIPHQSKHFLDHLYWEEDAIDITSGVDCVERRCKYKKGDYGTVSPEATKSHCYDVFGSITPDASTNWGVSYLLNKGQLFRKCGLLRHAT